MAGNSLPWLPWFHRDFLAATQGWTLLERGAYFMLLNAQWEMGALPTDQRRLAGIIGAQLEELQSVWLVVGPKFERTKAGLVNERLEQHRARQALRSEVARESALARWGKNSSRDADLHANACADADANASKSHAKSDANTHANGYANGYANSMLPEPEPKKKEDSPLAIARGAPVASATPAAQRKSGSARALNGSANGQHAGVDRELQQKIVAAYHECLPELPRVKDWNVRRQKKLAARILERMGDGKPASSVEYWRKIFSKAASSDFLCGRKTDWRCPGLEWMLEPRNFTKLIEGAYDNQQRSPRRAHDR